MKTYNPTERKAKYEWFKARGICTSCGKEKAFEQMTMCPACLERNSARAFAWRMKNQEAAKASNKRCYDKKKAEGRCIKCGKPNPNADQNCRCPKCARDWKIWCKTNRVRKVKPDGICKMCDRPVYPGKKLCEAHWMSAKRAILSIRPENGHHPWRMDEDARRAALQHFKGGNGNGASGRIRAGVDTSYRQ